MKKKYNVYLLIGIVLLALFILMAFAPGLFTKIDRKDMFEAWLPQSSVHILGTNSLGYDIFAELVFGARQTLMVGVVGSILAALLGIAIGILSTIKGIFGSVFSGLINIFVLIPRIVCLVVLASFVGSSNTNLIILVAAFSWVAIARNIKAKVESIYQQTFIQALRLQGFSELHIIVYHVLPNLADVILTRFLLGVNSCIMMESTLSFLGLGDLYYPTWGTMINFAFKRGAFIRRAYAYLLTPGICISLLSLAFYFIGTYFEHRKDTID